MASLQSAPQLVCVDPRIAYDVWPHVVVLLKAAVFRTELGRFEEIEYDVLTGRGLLWLAWSGQIEAAATTVLTETNASKVCVLTACGGTDMRRWLALLEKIEVYAKAEGCNRVRIFGRKGWQRMLNRYHVTNVVLERKL